MIGIGIRVISDTKLFYTIVEQTPKTITFNQPAHLNVPLALYKPEQLSYVRNTMLDIINEYEVTRACIKLFEFGSGPHSKITNAVVRRCNIEGVLQELIANSAIEEYLAGRMDKLAPKLGIAKTIFKRYAEAEDIYPTIPQNWDWKKDFNQEERESILAAMTALQLG